METVRIDTPQNVLIEYNVATIVGRGLASLLDWLVLAAYTILFFLFAKWFHLQYTLPEWVLIVILGLPWLLYRLLFEIFMDGKSVGKRLMNMKVARLDGGQPGLGHYLMRWVLRPVDTLVFLGAVVLIFNGKGQRLGDIAAGTCVISLRKRLRLEDTLLVQVPPDHVPLYPQVVRMSDANARLLHRVVANTSERRNTLITEMAVRLRDQLGVVTEQQPEAFLRSLLLDYVFLTDH